MYVSKQRGLTDFNHGLINMTLHDFKVQINNVFDDDLHTKQWHNIADWTIMALILISTIEVFLSTFDVVAERYGKVLMWVDWITQIFFTIEVTLRIWNADMLAPKYKGFKGRLRYCFSFYGLIDILSTYPFYLNLFVSLPYSALKVLRIVRLLRVFRYMHSFKLLSAAIKSKKSELLVSLQFLAIVTIILSFILFFVEHQAQPEVYDNGWSSVVWAFAQYIQDPGGFADMPPITLTGQIISVIVGILGIAIFAVPAGLIGSGFTEVMEEEQKDRIIKKNIKRLEHAFRFVQCRHTKYIRVPAFVALDDIKSKYRISEADILEAIDASKEFRLRNLATTRPIEERPTDRLVVEMFPVNRPYGCFINRDSNITIVSTSSHAEAATGHFAYYLAKIGGFNFVSKEIEVDPENPVTYYNISNVNACPNLPAFLDDINTLSSKENSWVIFILSASGGQEPVYPTQFHYIIGSNKGDESYDDPNITIHDVSRFDNLYQDLSLQIRDQYELESDRQKYHTGTSPKNIARHIGNNNAVNAFTIRIAWSVTCWDFRSLQISKTMADAFNKHLADVTDREVTKELTIRIPGKDYGYDFYTE